MRALLSAILTLATPTLACDAAPTAAELDAADAPTTRSADAPYLHLADAAPTPAPESTPREQTPTAPRVVLGHVTIQGGYDRSTLQRIFANHRRDLQRCAAAGPRGGSVTLRYIINDHGAKGVHVLSSQASPAIDACLIRELERWSWPRPSCAMVVVEQKLTIVAASAG